MDKRGGLRLSVWVLRDLGERPEAQGAEDGGSSALSTIDRSSRPPAFEREGPEAADFDGEMKRTDDVQDATGFQTFDAQANQGVQEASVRHDHHGWSRRVSRCGPLALLCRHLRIGGALLGVAVTAACAQMDPAAEKRVAERPVLIESPGPGASLDPTRVSVTREYFAASGRHCIEFDRPDDAGGRYSARACQRDGRWVELRPFAP
jgi:hypothetical protein